MSDRPRADLDLVRFYASLGLTTGVTGVDRACGGLFPPSMVVVTIPEGGSVARTSAALACWFATEFTGRGRRVVLTSGREWGALLRVAVQHRTLAILSPGALPPTEGVPALGATGSMEPGRLRAEGVDGDLARHVADLMQSTEPIDCWIVEDAAAISGDLIQALLAERVGLQADLPVLLRRVSRRRMCVLIVLLPHPVADDSPWAQYADSVVRVEHVPPDGDVLRLTGDRESVWLRRLPDRFVETDPPAEPREMGVE